MSRDKKGSLEQRWCQTQRPNPLQSDLQATRLTKSSRLSTSVSSCRSLLNISAASAPEIAMNCRVTAAALVICLAFTSVAAEGQTLRCRCIERRANFIPPKHIHDLERIPAGAHCERTEVIITMKGGRHEDRKICVDPDAKWVKALMEFMTKKLNNKRR
ncbi:hypothetical protein AAFF_G00108790 [Aldrovandia affinis]|uniref:Chemokine interleukin-8-like domain-containing protein n=1 Tax=Aldrovandia affinis TaxID=143900 RepID=A0AAD7RU85_9TELE|nr:hypothetical protein AAFF_G00108790 [Aldrovandia affinis]